MQELGLSQALLDKFRKPQVLEDLKVSYMEGGQPNFAQVGTPKISYIRVHSVWVEPIFARYENRIFVEGILHLQFQPNYNITSKNNSQTKVQDLTFD